MGYRVGRFIYKLKCIIGLPLRFANNIISVNNLLFAFYRALKSDVVARDVTGLAGDQVAGHPPVRVRVVHNLHLVTLGKCTMLKWQY